MRFEDDDELDRCRQAGDPVQRYVLSVDINGVVSRSPDLGDSSDLSGLACGVGSHTALPYPDHYYVGDFPPELYIGDLPPGLYDLPATPTSTPTPTPTLPQAPCCQPHLNASPLYGQIDLLRAELSVANGSRDLLQKEMNAQLEELRALRRLERAVRGVVSFRDALVVELADINDARKG